jgi:DNA modification methylase
MKKEKTIQIQTQKPNLKINISDVVVSDLTKSLYDYSNRENEINTLVMSISQIGQQQPITVINLGNKYIVIDGVLRLKAMKRLNLNEIESIVIEFTKSDALSLLDLIIHHQIRKQKTQLEKLNEIRSLLRIDSKDRNPLRDKEQRITLISSMLGNRGWRRNNVISLETILRWEKENGSELSLGEKVISNELSVRKALEIIDLRTNPLYNDEKENESHIVDGFIKGQYSSDQAVHLMDMFDKKKNEGHTVINLHLIKEDNFKILQGNIEEIDLPGNLEIDTIFTSPPYYKLVRYGDDPNELGWESTPNEYIKRLADILMKCFEKLKSTGSMFINIGETYNDQECLGISDRLVVELIGRGVRYVDRIIWKKDSNKPIGNQVKRLNSGYESILHFSKTRDFHFERFKIEKKIPLRVASGCKEKGSKKIGRHIPNNYFQFRDVLDENNVSNILSVQINKNRTKHIKGEKRHPATFSSNLPVIPLLISTPRNKNSVVFDPFLGSGSCGSTALLLGFKFYGVELYEENIQTARRILSESQEVFDRDSLSSFMGGLGSLDESDNLGERNQAA